MTVDVHARDIVEQLIEDKVNNITDFGWQMQLRRAPPPPRPLHAPSTPFTELAPGNPGCSQR
eukprot:2040351-Pyramimonas_sp.AAC.1